MLRRNWGGIVIIVVLPIIDMVTAFAYQAFEQIEHMHMALHEDHDCVLTFV